MMIYNIYHNKKGNKNQTYTPKGGCIGLTKSDI